jgi:sporulation protein YlmC with PRC-barrel domain/ribosomal protein L34E
LSKKRKSFKQDATNQIKSGIKMEKTDNPLTRDALVSMQVIDAKGHLVGKVKDIAFTVGKTGICLTVENQAGETQNISWDEVQAASDFILIKPVPQSAFSQPMQQPQQQLPVQNSSLTEEEKVFGAYEKQEPQQQPQQEQQTVQTVIQEKSNQPLCPTCNQPLTWIPQYKRWYCYTDKKYVLVGKKKFLGLMNSGNSSANVKTDAQQPSNQPHCPTCDQPLTWIPQYKRWYCYTDKKYV